MLPFHLRIPIRSDKLGLDVLVDCVVAKVKTSFQEIEIVETAAFGKILLLDGHVQLASLDEHAYHEALVQIPMLNLDSPRSALVIGGGDGGVLRELCRHRSLERIDMAEIDQGVIDTCREHLPELSAGAFDDPRVHVHVTDAFEFIQSPPASYDLIVADSTDVYEEEDGGLSEQLFTDAFYADCRKALSPGGIIVTQADNLLFCPYSLEGIAAMFGRVFPHVGSYQALVPSFGGFSGFCYASNGLVLAPVLDEEALTRIPLRYLNSVTYRFAFTPLPF
jgi:spermidine synthase